MQMQALGYERVREARVAVNRGTYLPPGQQIPKTTCLQQFPELGPHDRFFAAAHVQFLVDLFDVRLDSIDGNPEFAGNLGSGQTSHEET